MEISDPPGLAAVHSQKHTEGSSQVCVHSHICLLCAVAAYACVQALMLWVSGEPAFKCARSLEPSKKPCSHAGGIQRGRDGQAPM